MKSLLKKTSNIRMSYNKEGNFIQASAEFAIDYSDTPIEDIVSFICVNKINISDWKYIFPYSIRHLISVPTKDNPTPVFKFVVPTIIFLKDTNYDSLDKTNKLLVYKALRQKALRAQKSINEMIYDKLEDMQLFINLVNEYATQKIDMINGEKFNEYVSYR